MIINITTSEANVIQVAIDHLYDEHTDILADAIRIGDNEQVQMSYHIQRSIKEIHEEIDYQLNLYNLYKTK